MSKWLWSCPLKSFLEKIKGNELALVILWAVVQICLLTTALYGALILLFCALATEFKRAFYFPIPLLIGYKLFDTVKKSIEPYKGSVDLQRWVHDQPITAWLWYLGAIVALAVSVKLCLLRDENKNAVQKVQEV